LAENLEQLVAGPLVANYPNCAVTNVEAEALPAGFEIWSAEPTLGPELFPILRPGQFKDLLNGSTMNARKTCKPRATSSSDTCLTN
jgi:hypothetical protein